ncbi:MAG: hypothetical protein U0R17_00030 [Acidimicrobiia bacterium]
MARLADAIIMYGIKPCEYQDFQSREHAISLGKEFRDYRDEIEQALKDGTLEELIESNSAIAKLVDSARATSGLIKRSTDDAARLWISWVDSFSSDSELGKQFIGSSNFHGMTDETLYDRIWQTVVINATNVSRYLDALKDSGHQFRIQEIGIQAPLFEKVFIEFELRPELPFTRGGVLVENISKDEFAKDKTAVAALDAERKRIFDEAKWILKLTTVAQGQKTDPVRGPIRETYIPLDENGLLIPDTADPKRKIITLDSEHLLGDNPKAEEFNKLAYGLSQELTLVAFMTSSFANCTNIKLEDVDPNANKKKVNKVKNKKNLVKFKTLKIEMLDEATRIIRESIAKGTEIPLQLVRGHFKHYTEERPLFGNRVGQWWWMGQIRGTSKAGAVLKDYEVVAPQTRANPPAPSR